MGRIDSFSAAQRRLLLFIFLLPTIGAMAYSAWGAWGADVARPADYSFDYVVTGAGGGNAASTNYWLTAQITTDSAVATRASSADYSIEGVSALEIVAVSSVVAWELY